MLIKLIKHELKSSYRDYLPIFAVVLVFSVLLLGTNNNQSIETFISLFGFTLITLTILFVLVIKNIFTSLGERIFGKSGYLLFTVPAKTKDIVLSRIISNSIWILSAIIISLIPILIFFSAINNVLSDNDMNANEFIINAILGFLGVDKNAGAMDMTFSVLMKVFDLLQLIAITLISYTLVHTIYKGERKKLMIFVIFVILYIFVSVIANTDIFLSEGTRTEIDLFGEPYEYEYVFRTTNQKGLLVLFKLILCTGLFFYSNKLIETKLELQ